MRWSPKCNGEFDNEENEQVVCEMVFHDWKPNRYYYVYIIKSEIRQQYNSEGMDISTMTHPQEKQLMSTDVK